MNYQKIKPVGILRTNGKDYWLIHPTPVENFDSWLRDRERVFYVVPRMSELTRHDGKGGNSQNYNISQGGIVYPYPRHLVVSGDYCLEYLTDIEIKVNAKGRTQTKSIQLDQPEQIAWEELGIFISDN